MIPHVLFIVCVLSLLLQATSSPTYKQPSPNQEISTSLTQTGIGSARTSSMHFLERKKRESSPQLPEVLTESPPHTPTDFENYLKSMAPFTANLWNKTSTILSKSENVTLVYPISLNIIFHIGLILARKDSGSQRELKELLGNEIPMIYPLWLPEFEKLFESMNIHSSSLIFVSPNRHISQEVQNFTARIGAPIVQDQDQLNQIFQNKTKGLLGELQLEVPDDGIMFLNMAFIKFKWAFEFERRTTAETFYRPDNTTMLTNYMSVNIITDYFEYGNEYIAFKLPFRQDSLEPSVHKEGDNNNPREKYDDYDSDLEHEIGYWFHEKKKPRLTWEMVVYIVYSKTHQLPTLNAELFQNLHNLLKDSLEEVDLLMPAFELNADFEFSKQNFPELLRDKNTDFPLADEKVKFVIRHTAHLCADQYGVVGSAISAGRIMPINLRTTYEIKLDHEFLVIIADGTTGAPVVVGRVQSPMEGNNLCESV